MTDAAVTAPTAPLWRRLIGFNLAHRAHPRRRRLVRRLVRRARVVGPSLDYFGDIDYNELSVYLAYIGGVVGFLVGLGFLNYPVARLLGYPPSLREKEEGGWTRYFSLCTDHKVVGIQYLWGIGLFFFIGGLNAMLIRTELLTPHNQVFPAGHVPDDRRHARHDDDGDDDERDPRPVRELLRPDHDRRPADGVPADRGAHVLAADGGRRDPDHDDLLRRLPDGLDGLRSRSRPRPTPGSTTTSSSSRWSASR